MAFRETLQRLRKEAGLSQAGLASKAGLPVRTIQNWEIGHRKPKAEPLLALAKALGVPVEMLLNELVQDAKPDKKASGRRKPKL